MTNKQQCKKGRKAEYFKETFPYFIKTGRALRLLSENLNNEVLDLKDEI